MSTAYYTNRIEALRTRVEGTGWVGLDDETRELLRQQAERPKVRRIKYDADQVGCPKVFG